MSKPLIFFLQFAGLITLFFSMPSALEGKSITGLIVGGVLLFIGAIGWRRRSKATKAK